MKSTNFGSLQCNNFSHPPVGLGDGIAPVITQQQPLLQPIANRNDTFTVTHLIRSGFRQSSSPSSEQPSPSASPLLQAPWYAGYTSTGIAPPLDPDNYSFLDGEVLKTCESILKNLPLRPRHIPGKENIPGYRIPNLQDPVKGLIDGVIDESKNGNPSFVLPHGYPVHLKLYHGWLAWRAGIIDPPTLVRKGIPLWRASQRDLSLQQINSKTGVRYTQQEKDIALQECIRLLGKNSVGIAKLMQIISNNPSVKNTIPPAVYLALSSFQSDLPPSWQPEEVVDLVEKQFKADGYLKAIANRPENQHNKQQLLNEGKVTIELLKNADGGIEPLGVASTAEVYRCKVQVVSNKTNEILLSQEQIMGNNHGRIIKVLKKHLVKPQWIPDWRIKPEDFSKQRLAKDRELVTKLFTLISDDQRVLDYWLGQVDVLYTSWEKELDLREGANNGHMLADAAILRDEHGHPKTDVATMFDVALSDFSTPNIDLQEEAKGVSIKQLMETKTYTRNVVSEGLFAYLEAHPKASIKDILASADTQKEIALMGLQRFKLNVDNPKKQTEALVLQMERRWENTPMAHRPPANEITTAIDLTNQLEMALQSVMAGVKINENHAPATPQGLQTVVNDILLSELKDANSKVLLKTIGLIQQYPWLVSDPRMMTQVGEAFAQASTKQMTEGIIHMDVTTANAYVYRDEALYEQLNGRNITQATQAKEKTKVFLKQAFKILLDPTGTDKGKQFIQLCLDVEPNSYRIQYIDTGGVESVDKNLFVNDLKLILGFCTGNPHQLYSYFESQITYGSSLSPLEQKRLMEKHNLKKLLHKDKLPQLVDVFIEELYSPSAEAFLENNPAKKKALEAELASLIEQDNPTEAFFRKLLQERKTLFKAEIPQLFNTQIFEVKDNVQNFDLAWSLVQSELNRRRIGYRFPHFDILKAKLLQVTTGYALLEMAGGDNNELLLKSLGRIFDKAYNLDKKAFETLKQQTLTHMFIAQPEQAGKMMALFLPEKIAEGVAAGIQQINRFKQVFPWLMAGLGLTAAAGVGVLKYNTFERDEKQRLQVEREEKAFIANIAIAQQQNRKLSKITPSLKEKGLLG